MIYARSFKNMAEAFTTIYADLHEIGVEGEGTKRITGALLEIANPMDWEGMPEWRNWKRSYVDLEWEWYTDATRNPDKVAAAAKIWDRMRDEKGEVNSNYGWQVERSDQWRKTAEGIVSSILSGKGTRKHVVTIFDGKEKDTYDFDTPCTISFSFVITERNLIDIHTHMRSNDIWFGFCNDIPAFGLFQKRMVQDVNDILLLEAAAAQSDRLFFEVSTAAGRLLHFVDDLHVYTPQQNKS